MPKKKILVICPHPENVAPGQRLKYEQYFDHFRQNGYTIVVSPFMTMAFWNVVYQRGHWLEKIFWTLVGYLRRVRDLFRIPFYDGLYIFLWVTPFGFPIFEWLFCSFKKLIIYDIDDMVFIGHVSSANKLIKPLKGRAKMTFLMKRANHNIVCTPSLEDFVRKYNQHVTDISSTINTDIYRPAGNYSNRGIVTLGWSGSHSTSKYLHLLDGILRDLTSDLKFKLLVIGDAHFAIDGVEVEAIPWREETEVSSLQRIDIGLYPLPDEEWVYGKSGLKALQYMALGIPTVAAAIGANHRVIEDNVSGFLVRDMAEWREKILLLAERPEERKRIGEKARERVERYYSVNANKDVYLSVMDKVFKSDVL